MAEPTPRLVKCFQAGEVMALFALLHTWSKSDLLALLGEIEQFGLNVNREIDECWADQSFLPENFFNANRSLSLDQAKDEARTEVLMTCSEISSVAQFYLKENYGVELVFPDE
jgi:hypothetical protein